MRVCRFVSPLWLLIAAAGACFAAGTTTPPAVLPQAFGGWHLVGAAQNSTNSDAADPTNAALLKEYGFKDFEGGTYSRADGRKLKIKAARFEDASGAYGAFTFYKMPQMLNEKIGDQGASLNERVLFYRGNILVDAVFQQLSAMSAAELRELAEALPRPGGSIANLPGLPAYLPKESYIRNTAKYIVGPVALEADQAPLPVKYVDFSKGAEVVLGAYNLYGARATLMLINYPTPQIADIQLKEIESARQAHQLDSIVTAKRTGPILVLASGSVSSGDAKSLVSDVNYDADVTWNERTNFTRRDNAANLIVGVILLAAIVCGISIVAGIAFGGFRVAMKRLLPGRVFDRPEDIEFISLHLSDTAEKPAKPGVSSSINVS
ncbi:MAG: DUF6599 family protein [Terriglobales bacterium]